MSGTNAHANDAMIRRLETELREKETFANGIIERANAAERDLTEEESGLMVETRGRMESIKAQLEQLEDIQRVAYETRNRAQVVDRAISTYKGSPKVGEVEYRSAGAFALDQYKASLNDREARERLEIFERAAQHQKTSDNLGIVPDPIIGGVINFVDGSRPIVSKLGIQAMPSANWHRPKVTQHTSVAKQGTNGAAADEKTELVSQKMTITRIDGSAVTYGGYVNVSRQDIDFASPSAMDAVVNDLALQYAVQTEAVAGATLLATTNEVEIAGTTGAPTADNLLAAVWTAVGNIYNATKGAGQVFIAVDPSKLGVWGSVFSPFTMNQDGRATGLQAGAFSQGVMGNVSGIPVVCSAGLGGVSTDYGVVASTAAVECYEQRVGLLQVTEPSVLGVQVAYAGYFTPMVIESGGLQRLVNKV